MINLIVCFVISISSIQNVKPKPEDLLCRFDADCGNGICWTGVCEDGICIAYVNCV